jgi:murein L,D-transpeptidase YcbB/YkuD
VRSIRRRLNEIGLYGRKPAKKLFTSAQNRSAQLQFAKEHLNWTPRQWKNIVFSDETKFNLYNSDEIQWVYDLSKERKIQS